MRNIQYALLVGIPILGFSCGTIKDDSLSNLYPKIKAPIEFMELAKAGVLRDDCIMLAKKYPAHDYKFISLPLFIDTKCKVLESPEEIKRFLVESVGISDSDSVASAAYKELIDNMEFSAIGFQNEGDQTDLLFFDGDNRLYGYLGNNGIVRVRVP